MGKIEWMNPCKGRQKLMHEEVSITLNKSNRQNGSQRYAVRVSFSADALSKFSESERIRIGIDNSEGKMYFADAGMNGGYKLLSNKEKSRYYVRFTIDNIREWAKREKDYRLILDETLNLWFIQF